LAYVVTVTILAGNSCRLPDRPRPGRAKRRKFVSAKEGRRQSDANSARSGRVAAKSRPRPGKPTTCVSNHSLDDGV
jgi:hypothetical protein